MIPGSINLEEGWHTSAGVVSAWEEEGLDRLLNLRGFIEKENEGFYELRSDEKKTVRVSDPSHRAHRSKVMTTPSIPFETLIRAVTATFACAHS